MGWYKCVCVWGGCYKAQHQGQGSLNAMVFSNRGQGLAGRPVSTVYTAGYHLLLK